MAIILDIHTHRPAPQPQGVISAEPEEYVDMPGQLWSVGLHPWHLSGDDDARFAEVERLALQPQVVAIGETGLDLLRVDSVPMFRQLNMLRRHIELSERVGKPLVLHSVRAQDMVCSLRRELGATQPWVVHGFRGKVSVARMYLDAGCHLSYGERFNEESLRRTPTERLLAETDESALNISEIIERLSAVRGMDLTSTIAANTATLLDLH